MARTLLDDDGISNPSRNASLTDVVERAIAAQPTRRRMLLGGLGAAMLPFFTEAYGNPSSIHSTGRGASVSRSAGGDAAPCAATALTASP